MKTKLPDVPDWGAFALVTYIPEPVGSFLSSVRQRLPGDSNPQAHITILPPRLLKTPVETASLEAKKILADFSRFYVELAGVQAFPETNVLYLDIAEGDDHVHALHDALNTGALADQEAFEFQPHLTISGPIESPRLDAMRLDADELWSSRNCSARLEIEEVVALWRPNDAEEQWRRLWSFRLPAPLAAKAKAGGSSGRD